MTKIIATKNITKETILTPRFYTTNFKEISTLDFTSTIIQLQAIVEELRQDYNKDFFIREKEFLRALKTLDNETQSIFLEFLERSCMAEFSGFLLYKEISRNLKDKNPLLAEGFACMSRDEARHAGFLNKAMSDFNTSLNLGFLTKTRKYTFFAPKFIFFATYLSEKIGYWRYITIYRHLEKNPNCRMSPLFKFFENWCQDENRHGDFFAVILKSQPRFLRTKSSKFWSQFFLISVFLTMYISDAQKENFYRSIGLNRKEFDNYVIINTNKSASKVFPVVLNTNNPDFFSLLDSCVLLFNKIDDIDKRSNNFILKFFLKIEIYFYILINVGKLFLLPTIKADKILL
jgi:magnesium-protoporphyrin IX monomethyl ester (oxidative) cyclase